MGLLGLGVVRAVLSVMGTLVGVPGSERTVRNRLRLAWLRRARVLLTLVGGVLAGLFWVGLLVTVPLFPVGMVHGDNAVDVLAAMDLLRGQWEFHGAISYSPGSFHPGPVLRVLMALGIAVSGSSQAVLGASMGVLIVVAVVFALLAALLAYRAGLAAGVAFTGGLVLVYQGVFGSGHAPSPGLLWLPAVAALVAYLVAPMWGLSRGGGWALPLGAAVACAGVQVYLLTAPASAVVLVAVLWNAWRLRGVRRQRPFVMGAFVVAAAGLLFVPARVVTEGPFGVVGSLVGQERAPLFSHVDAALVLISDSLNPFGWLMLLPALGVPLGLLAARWTPRAWLLRPLGLVVASTGAYALMLMVTLLTVLNRAATTSVEWPLQGVLVLHALVLAVLVVSGVVVAGAEALRRCGGRSHRVWWPGVVASGVVLVVALSGAWGVAQGPQVQAAPWLVSVNEDTPGFAEQLRFQGAESGVTLATMLIPREPGSQRGQVVEVHPNVSEPWAAGLLALVQQSEVCWRDGFRGALPPRPACDGEGAAEVLVALHPAWPNPYVVPGDPVAQVSTEEGTLIVVRMPVEVARSWLEGYEPDPREEVAVEEFYCLLTGCTGSGE